MFAYIKNFWSSLRGQSPNTPIAPESLGLQKIPNATPVVIEHCEPQTSYFLPLRWSLYFALTNKQWRGLRDRHKERHTEWHRCSCPKSCKANTLDEKWNYDYDTHTKIFISAEFICPGCHWLKSPTWRIETWREIENGFKPAINKPVHIIDCLGWTQQRVDELRANDLRKHEADLFEMNRHVNMVKQGESAIVPAPLDRLTKQELALLVKPGQTMIIPWRVDLSALAVYGYSLEEIEIFEQCMYQLAAKRISGIEEPSKLGKSIQTDVASKSID